MVSFSLILGTVERTHDLENHLASLDYQTYRNFELIIVDQNKDERLAPILEPYASRFQDPPSEVGAGSHAGKEPGIEARDR